MTFFKSNLSKLSFYHLMQFNIISEAHFYEDFGDIFVFSKLLWELEKKYQNVEKN